eukprot:365431-Chlamydomonas_euryale.AAC.26
MNGGGRNLGDRMEGRAAGSGGVLMVAAPCLLSVPYLLPLQVIFDCLLRFTQAYPIVSAPCNSDSDTSLCRQQLLNTHKKMRVSLSKRHRSQLKRDGMSGNSSEDEAIARATFDDLPMHVASIVVQHLEPLSLAALACTCTQMRDLVLSSNATWKRCTEALFPVQEQTGQDEPTVWHQVFCERASGIDVHPCPTYVTWCPWLRLA